jgi:hypothetical protein
MAVDTFVIRLWSPADPATTAHGDPRGVVRHVGTGRAEAFRDGTELLALLRELPGPENDHRTAQTETRRTPAGPHR